MEREDFFKGVAKVAKRVGAAGGVIGTTIMLGGCADYPGFPLLPPPSPSYNYQTPKPPEYALDFLSPICFNRETLSKAFEGITPTNLTLQPKGRPVYVQPPWMVNTVELFIVNTPLRNIDPVPSDSHTGIMIIMTDIDYKTLDQDNKWWQGCLLVTDAIGREDKFKIIRLQVDKADQVIIGHAANLAPELRDKTVVNLFFVDPRGNHAASSIRNSKTISILALMQVTQDYQPVEGSQLLFHIQPSSLQK